MTVSLASSLSALSSQGHTAVREMQMAWSLMLNTHILVTCHLNGWRGICMVAAVAAMSMTEGSLWGYVLILAPFLECGGMEWGEERRGQNEAKM